MISLISCNTLNGHRGISESIEESKRLKVFQKELKLEPSIDEIKGLKHAWIENGWNYSSKKNEPRIRKGYETLILEFNDVKDLDNYNKLWKIVEVFPNGDTLLCPNAFKSKILFCEGSIYSNNKFKLYYTKGNIKSRLLFSPPN